MPPENHGNQLLFIIYRTDKEQRKKADLFGYSPTLPPRPGFPPTPARRKNDRLAADL